MNINQSRIRILGLFGILGGIILFIGDMLFYYNGNSTDLLTNMGNNSDFRIIASSITALFATWFYLIGLAQVYYAFKPASPVLRNVVLFCFGSILIAYGIIHANYTAIAATAKLSVQNHLDIKTATALALESNQILRLFVYPFFAVLSFVFIAQVWKRKTLYPRWIIFFFPLFSFLLQGPLNMILTGKIKTVVVGGYLNIILIIFFSASVIALWNIKPKSDEV